MPETPETPESSAPLSPIERYQLARAHIEHEDNLVTQRLNWLIASQSFLFTAYAITTNTPDSLRGDMRHRLLLALIPLIAICTAVLVFLTVMGGFFAMRDLHAWLRPYEASSQAAGLPPVQGRAITRTLGMTAPVLLPPIFVMVWVYLMTTGL
jgi:hypothetical protein